MTKGFDSSCIMPSFLGALSVWLVIEGTIIIIVPLVTSFQLDVLSLLAPIVDPATCFSVADDVTQVFCHPDHAFGRAPPVEGDC
jgi:hypothetical protein